MKARASTDGNLDELRDRVFTAQLNGDSIRLAKTQGEAIDNFCKGAPYISEVVRLDYFQIGDETYWPDYWAQQST